MPDSEKSNEKPIEEIKEENANITKKDLEVFSNTISLAFKNIDERLKQIETAPQKSFIAPTETQQNKPLDINALAALAPLLSSGDNTIDKFYKDLGERTFFRLLDKILPTRKELRGNESDLIK